MSDRLPPPPALNRPLGDKLQWLAIADPAAARVIERLVDHQIARLERLLR